MPGTGRSPIAAAPDGVTVAVRVTPRASRSRVTGTGSDAGGRPYLAIAVSAAPEDGKANDALIKLLAKEWRVAKSALTVRTGATSRHKTLHVAGDPDRLLLDLGAWLADIR